MRKSLIMICMSVGITAGGFLPQLWGDRELFSVASILCGMIGGFLGIWIGVKISKQLS